MSFINDRRGWLLGGKMLWGTFDGGETWKQIGLINHEDDVFHPRQMIFLNQSHGMILEAYNGLWFTTDAGKKWQHFQSEKEMLKADFELAGNGLVICEDGSLVKVSTRKEKFFFEEIKSQFFLPVENIELIDKDHGRVLAGPTIWSTHNGGLSWAELSSGKNLLHDLFAISFISKQIGWGCGYHTDYISQGGIKRSIRTGIVHKTTDGGRNWQVIYREPGIAFDEIYFSDEKNGWILADDKVLVTVDGGFSWEKSLDLKNPSNCF